MEELKEHDRMRLIRERETRRLGVYANESPPFSANSRDQTSRDTWVSKSHFCYRACDSTAERVRLLNNGSIWDCMAVYCAF